MCALFAVKVTDTLSQPDEEAVKFTDPTSVPVPPTVRNRTVPVAVPSARSQTVKA